MRSTFTVLLLLMCSCVATNTTDKQSELFNDTHTLRAIDVNHDGVAQSHEIQQAMDRPSGLVVFICLAGVLISIVVVTMTYSKLVAPKTKQTEPQLIQEDKS